MAKRQAIDSIYRQTKAASTTAKSKAGKTVHRQSVKTVKTFKTTYYISEAAQRALEHERHERRMAGKRKGSDFSSLVDAAILKAYGKRGSFDEAADAFTEGMKRDKKRRR